MKTELTQFDPLPTLADMQGEGKTKPKEVMVSISATFTVLEKLIEFLNNEMKSDTMEIDYEEIRHCMELYNNLIRTTLKDCQTAQMLVDNRGETNRQEVYALLAQFIRIRATYFKGVFGFEVLLVKMKERVESVVGNVYIERFFNECECSRSLLKEMTLRFEREEQSLFNQN
jgi:hypothetical protein